MHREYWYAACASSQLGSKPRAVQILDQELVVFRDGASRACALVNRCCHRGVKLSLGRITDGNLACGYHGWQYDGKGCCVRVPSLPKAVAAPGLFRVRAFKCVERDGYIWVWMGEGEPDPAEPEPIPDFAEYSWTQGVSPMACSATMTIENQFDSAHPAFAHEGTHPSYYAARMSGPRDFSFEVRTSEDGMVSFFPCTASDDAPVPTDFNSYTRFQLPSRVYVHQRLLHFNFFVVMHVVPTGPNTCRMEWLQRKKKGEHSVTWIEQEPLLITQDRVLLESAQPAYDAGDDFERSVSADFVTMMVRKVVALAESGRWKQDREQVLPKRHLVKSRV